MESYDVVVIGAGNGGLTASVTLAQKGLKVLLLERHNIPGGCATSFCRGRFEFEVALHQLSGVGTPENPGPLRMLFDQLGILDDLELVEMKDLFHVIGPGDFRLALKTDRASGDRRPPGKVSPGKRRDRALFRSVLSVCLSDAYRFFISRTRSLRGKNIRYSISTPINRPGKC